MTFRDLIGRTLRIRGLDVTFSHWRKWNMARVYVNAPGSGCTPTDYVNLRTGELKCSRAAQALIEAALDLQKESP